MKRLYSIDVLRGMALAGMILVNNPGSWSHIYTPFEHAPFAGLTLADLVFPTFMFVMGFCIPLSLKKYGFTPSAKAFGRIARRTVIIFGIGVFLQWMSRGWCAWSELRIPGVLQRLALCYGVCASLLLLSKRTMSLSVSVVILFIYSIILRYGQGNEWSEANIVARVDHYLLGANHLYVDEGIRLDPEGLLSTLPSIAHVMIGAFTSLLFMGEITIGQFRWGRKRKEQNADDKTALARTEVEKHKQHIHFLLTTAFTLIIVAVGLHCDGFPIIKKVWSPSFVCITIGIAYLVLAGLIWLFDVKRWTGWWSQCFVVFGRNPLLIYVISWILADWFGAWGVTWNTYQWLSQYCSPCLSSLIYAILFVSVNWAIAFGLYKAKVKVSA